MHQSPVICHFMLSHLERTFKLLILPILQRNICSIFRIIVKPLISVSGIQIPTVVHKASHYSQNLHLVTRNNYDNIIGLLDLSVWFLSQDVLKGIVILCFMFLPVFTSKFRSPFSSNANNSIQFTRRTKTKTLKTET